jgi:hypothetical protein
MATRVTQLIVNLLAATFTLAISIYLGIQISATQSLWSFPGAYLVEVSLLSLLAAVVSLLDLAESARALWIIAGFFFSFMILGSMSIGLFYFPTFLLVGISAILTDIRHKGKLLPHLGFALLGAIAQAAIIWLVILHYTIFQPAFYP